MKEKTSRNFFLLDKNYLLKQIQQENKTIYLDYLISEVKNAYLRNCNPLGLIDDTVLSIQSYQNYEIDHLEELYDLLSGIFRYQIGTNQLELLFDGKNHYDKYKEDWESCFKDWVSNFSGNERFLKLVLAITVFYHDEFNAILVKNRLKNFISSYFNLKIYRYKGLIKSDAA